MNENKLTMSSSDFSSIQEAIDKAKDYATIILDSEIYTEGLVISKPLTFVGQSDSIIRLHTNQIKIKGTVEVRFEQVTFDILSHHYDAAIQVYGSKLICKACTFKSAIQKRDLFSCIWVEAGSFILEDSKVNTQTDFIKIINGEILELKHNELEFKNGKMSLETHGMKHVTVVDNRILSCMNLIRSTKTTQFSFDNNTINATQEQGLSKPTFILVDGLEHGDYFSLSNNTILAERELYITVSNSLSINRKILITNNEIRCSKDIKSKITLDHLQGLLVLEGNQLQTGHLFMSKCSELVLRENVLLSMAVTELKQIMATDNRFLMHVMIDAIHHVDFKKNHIVNGSNDSEAIKLSTIDKLVFEQNKITSADHGITLLNAGDNLEISILKNEFLSCRKRAINIASTMQKKYLKTEVNISKNVFLRNDKGIYIDDRNLKACYVTENYFAENKDAVVILGGKSTSSIKVAGNYLDNSNQKIELRSAQMCSLSHNELSDSRISIRGSDEIVIHGNHFDKGYYSLGKSYHNEVSIKAGGCLTVSHNVMLTGKPRHEKKEIMDYLNIAAYERNSAINIYNNKPLEGIRKVKWFETESVSEEVLYPDGSLLSALSYQIDSKQNLSEMNIDDVMKSEFFKIRDALVSIRDKMVSLKIKESLSLIIKGFEIELFEDKDSNDIYRFIVKSNETVEMLKIYTTMADETDAQTEERIVMVLNNYKMVLDQLVSKRTENDQDALNAQLKLLENLL
ncbi:MAG: hypothetical protein JEZ08_01020 [Clostridiales bacterium]|nr:hypothetical protein [Clostridiales bacterium]